MRPEALAAPEPQRLRTVGEEKRSPPVPAPQGWTGRGNTLGVVSDPRTAPGSESWVSAGLCLFAPHGLSGRRSSSARLLFSARQGSAPGVLPRAMPASGPQSRPPEGGRQGPGPQPVPASFPPSYSGMRGSHGLRISARTLRRLGRCSQQPPQGVLSVSSREAGVLEVCFHFPRCWKNVLG